MAAIALTSRADMKCNGCGNVRQAPYVWVIYGGAFWVCHDCLTDAERAVKAEMKDTLAKETELLRAATGRN